jgi:polar amino acid transport system permease protein
MRAIEDNFFDLDALDESLTLLWLGMQLTLKLVVLAFIVALVLGGAVAWLRAHRHWAARRIAATYVDLLRATPPLVTLVVIHFVVPAIVPELSFTTFQSAVIAFGLVHSAYISEIYRGGILAIDPGQGEAATSLGLSPFQSARLVLVPQITRVVIPPLTSQATQMVRDSSLAFIIGYAELLSRAREAEALTANATPLFGAAVVYMVLLLGLQGVSYHLEKQNEVKTAT